MKILKLRGKSEGAVKQQIAKEYGEEALILSSYQERAQGVWGFVKKTQWVTTIAIEETIEKDVATTSEITERIDALHMQMKALQIELRKRKEGGLANTQQNVYQLFETKLLAQGVHPEVVNTLIDKGLVEVTVEEGVRQIYHNIVKGFPQGADYNVAQQVVFIGPTGVGKTTTIAKLTADQVLNHHKKVVLMTADTYRIAAIEQLRTYADILSVPLEIIYEDKDLISHLEKWQNQSDYIFVDTAGRSHKNVEQMIDMKALLEKLVDKKIYLVLNMNTQFQDLKKIVASYELITSDFEVIVTKSDETDVIGNLLNIAYCTQKPIAYLTMGQNVPDDFERFDPHEYTKDLLGRMSYE